MLPIIRLEPKENEALEIFYRKNRDGLVRSTKRIAFRLSHRKGTLTFCQVVPRQKVDEGMEGRTMPGGTKRHTHFGFDF